MILELINKLLETATIEQKILLSQLKREIVRIATTKGEFKELIDESAIPSISEGQSELQRGREFIENLRKASEQRGP